MKLHMLEFGLLSVAFLSIGSIVLHGNILLGKSTALAKPHSFVADAETAASSGSDARADLAPILDFMPFGKSESVEISTEAESIDNAFYTPSEYILVGILLDQMPQSSRAILSGIGEKMVTVSLGEILPDGAVVAKIGPDSIDLEYDGVLTSLNFPNPVDVTEVIQDEADFVFPEFLDSDLGNAPDGTQDE